jgi:hypothetical protein
MSVSQYSLNRGTLITHASRPPTSSTSSESPVSSSTKYRAGAQYADLSCLTAHDVQLPPRREAMSASKPKPNVVFSEQVSNNTSMSRPTVRSVDGVDVVRGLAGAHERVHPGETTTSTARKTPEGISYAGKGGQKSYHAGIKPHVGRHSGDSRYRAKERQGLVSKERNVFDGASSRLSRAVS